MRWYVAALAVVLAPESPAQQVTIHAGQQEHHAQFGLPPIGPIPPLVTTQRPHGFNRQGNYLAPFFWDYYPWANGYQASPNVVVVAPQAQAAPPVPPSPPQPVRPEIHEYKQPPEAASDPAATFVIVANNGAVTQATAVWVEGGSVHFFTPDGDGGSLPLSSVNRQATREANDRKGLTLRL